MRAAYWTDVKYINKQVHACGCITSKFCIYVCMSVCTVCYVVHLFDYVSNEM